MRDAKLEGKLGFDRIREAISDRCSTDYASGRVATEEFSTDAEIIRKRLLLTDEMRLVLMFEENFPTAGYIDAIPFLAPLEKEGSHIDTLSLGKLKTIMDTVRRVKAFFNSIDDSVYPQLLSLCRDTDTFPEVIRRIETILDKNGDIKDSASEALFSIRRSIRDTEASISRRATAILREAVSQGIAEEGASVTIRDGKYLIPVNTALKRRMHGFVMDESSTGKTTFIEPAEIVEMENDLNELYFAETREIERILVEFTSFLRPYVPDLIRNAALVGELDFIMAKANTALDFVAGMPIIAMDGALSLRKARHPLLERALKKDGKEIVPISITLTSEKHILLISGPNAGGKSVCLKTAGLLQYMFQWGMLVPTSETSELPVFKRIMVSIGDDQSLENDLSTYSSFLNDMRMMLSEADSQTLVLIDEFGSGTEPAAGGAIAEAILAELDRRGVYGVITTHYTNLKLYASSAQTGVANGAMMFDAARIEPLFKLEIGMPGNSFAFELARKMKLPETIVKDAEERAGEEFVGIERNLRRIVRGRRALEEKLQKVKHTDKELEGLTEKYVHELEDIKAQRDKILLEARMEAESIVKNAGSQVEKTIRVIKETQADKEKTKAARQELQGFLGALEQKKTRDEYLDRKIEKASKRKSHGPQQSAAAQGIVTARKEPLKVGEKVRVIENGAVGEVTKVSAKSVTIALGSIRSTMSADRLERISSNEYRAAQKQTVSSVIRYDTSVRDRKLNFSPEIDVRGQRLSEALDTITHYIDDAIMLSMGSVRIIHGKGSGVLREELQKYLRTVPGIASVKDEDVRHGGTGVTIVELQ